MALRARAFSLQEAIAAANSADVSTAAPLDLNLGNLATDSLIPRRNRALSAADQERIASILAGEPEGDDAETNDGAGEEHEEEDDDEGDDEEEEFEDADDDGAEVAAEAGGTYVAVLCSGLMWSQSQVRPPTRHPPPSFRVQPPTPFGIWLGRFRWPVY